MNLLCNFSHDFFSMAANMIARRNYGQGSVHKYPTMNDMPVPEGDFFAMHAKRNRKYNAILATGIAVFSTACYIVSFFFEIYMNIQ